ncbi:acyl-CoA dehydrogenase family protein [Streptomyces mirabilis]|uniref:acyl-CoA dehydrogenase family protein n=1 Tax=Streptomyces mirabilis TaxID=68239 RepID=UPI00225B9B67|nr:acyl-CoA dehydrogenase family protein [Streptomyces mirabilis]MCX4428526.1 acyl-CoA dehydrogenase family protein [Streptomyces mirabilis]
MSQAPEERRAEPAWTEFAQNLVPLLRDHATRTEERCRPTEEVVAALRDAGMLRLETPRELGGAGADLPTQMSVCAELARGCPSTAWLVGINSTGKELALTKFSSVTREILRENPDSYFATVGNVSASAVRTNGGYRVTGRGGFASGCEVADWVIVWAIPSADSEQQLVSVVVPASQVKIERTWNTAGMCGTGSHTVVVEDVFVPEIYTAVSQFEAATNSFSDLPQPQQLLRAIAIEVPALVGAAHGAFDVVRQSFAAGKSIADTVYTRMSDSPSARHWLAQARHDIDSAYAHMGIVADALAAYSLNEPMRLDARLRVRMHMASAVTLSRQAVSKLLDLGGASSFSRSHPLQRFWRDLEVGSRHARLNPYIAMEDYGRHLAAEEAPTAVLV